LMVVLKEVPEGPIFFLRRVSVLKYFCRCGGIVHSDP